MMIAKPYNAHFERSSTGHAAVARSCGDGWWEEWVRVGDREWRRFAELALDGRARCSAAARREAPADPSRPRPSAARRMPPLLWSMALVATLLGCAARPAAPPTPAPAGVDPDVAELLVESEQAERELREKGLVDDEPALQAYVDSIGRRVVSAGGLGGPSYHFAVLRDPFVNAFAMPNGAVYVHAGLLARIESEAQLAYVLAHEAVHVARGHSLARLRYVRSVTTKAKIADIFVGALAGPMIGLTYAASVSGHGQEAEAEADREAIRMLVGAGYRGEEAVRTFALLDDPGRPGGTSAFLFSDHPAAAERETAARAALSPLGGGAAGEDGRDRYLFASRGVSLRTIDLALQRQLYARALGDAEAALARRGADPALLCQAGEAHRSMAADPEGAAREAALGRGVRPGKDVASLRARVDGERAAAEAAFRRALGLDPSFGPAHRGLGLLARDRGDRATARAELSLYLRDAGVAADRRAIERVLQEVSS